MHLALWYDLTMDTDRVPQHSVNSRLSTKSMLLDRPINVSASAPIETLDPLNLATTLDPRNSASTEPLLDCLFHCSRTRAPPVRMKCFEKAAVHLKGIVQDESSAERPSRASCTIKALHSSVTEAAKGVCVLSVTLGKRTCPPAYPRSEPPQRHYIY